MIDKELEAKIQCVKENGSADECFRLSDELWRRAEALSERIWPNLGRCSNWDNRIARREEVHGVSLDSEVHVNYLARHKWPKYKRQYANYKSMLALGVASVDMGRLGRSRLEVGE